MLEASSTKRVASPVELASDYTGEFEVLSFKS